MSMKNSLLTLCFLLVSGLCYGSGGVTIGGTRVIYDGSEKEATLSVSNTDSSAYLLQSWVSADSEQTAPFIVTPPLFKIEGEQQSVLRIIKTNFTVPNDRESLYWLNIKAIPSGKKSKNSSLQIAVKSKLKLIFRPSLLEGVPEDFTSELKWSRDGNYLIVHNDTPFTMNFSTVEIGGKKINDANYVLPKSQARYKIPFGVGGRSVSWKIISDYGGVGKKNSTSLQ
jgi:fimbrial chaperone protein